ncbi:class IV lanthionine synthetase LanL [Streptomyces sp. NPDC005500]|uniref:class IV lanthionine synthetase LanL n=1 Tax=Streptomyces sp. NPDC005500 TaxID=3155007 RepID=UPI0033AD6CBF
MTIHLSGAAAGAAGMSETMLIDCVRSLLGPAGHEDWQVSTDAHWCHVQPSGSKVRVQGWKLHVSATPLLAPVVLVRAAEVLIRHRCAFKFAATLERVEEIVSPRCDRGSGGKYITVYPGGDEGDLRLLAEELHRATQGLPGPGILSDRQYRPGSLVHYRFGVFRGVRMLGNDGLYEAMLLAPDGSLVLDQRKAWFTPPPWAPPDPFTPGSASSTPGARTPKAVLLDGRYVVREAVRHAYKGGVFKATDQHTGQAVVIKQARPHVGSTLTGNDVRDALRHEADMLQLFASCGITPRPLRLFEQQGDLFLVQEEVDGTTLRTWVEENTVFRQDGAWGLDWEPAKRIVRWLTELIKVCHNKGLVLRDFNPNNVMVTTEGRVRLIDLELLARPGTQSPNLITRGYAAPEQATGRRIAPAPEQTADLFSLGATLFYLVSGADPVLPRDTPQVPAHPERLGPWLDLIAQDNPTARRLTPLIIALMHPDPAKRPSLDTVGTFLDGDEPPAAHKPCMPGRVFEPAVSRLLTDGLDHLITTMEPDNDQHLWPTGSDAEGSDPLNVQHGAAGILAVLTRALRHEPGPRVRQSVTTAAAWIHRRIHREPRMLPGLYFGRSGTAWALLEAGHALGDDRLTEAAIEVALRVPLHWSNSDLCHGTAGSGLTQLRFWEATGQDIFLTRAAEAAAAVIAAAHHHNGKVTWPVPLDFPSRLAGAAPYGFAHGVAGVGVFLLAAGQALHDLDCLDIASAAADTLAAAAQVKDGAAYWPGDKADARRRTHWCSGSSGVGSFLLRMWQAQEDTALLQLAEQAATAVHRSRWRIRGTAQCHGLSGEAEFLLDLAEATGHTHYRTWAEDLLACMQARHTLHDSRMILTGESVPTPSAGYNTGIAGTVALLLRLQDKGPRLWLPHTLTQFQHSPPDCLTPRHRR